MELEFKKNTKGNAARHHGQHATAHGRGGRLSTMIHGDMRDGAAWIAMGGPVGAGIFMVSAKAKTSNIYIKKIDGTMKTPRFFFTSCETCKVAGREGGRQAGKQADKTEYEVPRNPSFACPLIHKAVVYILG